MEPCQRVSSNFPVVCTTIDSPSPPPAESPAAPVNEATPPPTDPRETLMSLVQQIFRKESIEIETILCNVKNGVPWTLMALRLHETKTGFQSIILEYQTKCEDIALRPYSIEGKNEVSTLIQEYKKVKAEFLLNETEKCKPVVEAAKNEINLRCTARLLFLLSTSKTEPSDLHKLFYASPHKNDIDFVLLNQNFILSDRILFHFKLCDQIFYEYHFNKKLNSPSPFFFTFNNLAFETNYLNLLDSRTEAKVTAEALTKLTENKDNPQFEDKIHCILAFFHLYKGKKVANPQLFIPLMEKYLSFPKSELKDNFIVIMLNTFELRREHYNAEEAKAIEAWIEGFLTLEDHRKILKDQLAKNCRTTIGYFFMKYLRIEKLTEAIDYAKLAATFDTEGCFFYMLTFIHLKKGDFQSAKEVVSIALTLQKYPRMLVLMGLLMEPDLTQAANYYKESLEQGSTLALPALKRIMPKIKIDKPFKKLIAQREEKVVDDAEGQSLVDFFSEQKSCKSWKKEMMQIFQSAPSSLMELESYREEKAKLQQSFLERKDQKDGLLQEARKKHEALISRFLEKQAEEERKKALEQKIEEMRRLVNEQMDQTMKEAEGIHAQLNSLKMESDFAEFKATFKPVKLKLQEKDDEIAKLKKLVEELTVSNRALVRQVKEKEEQLEQQEREFKFLEEVSASWTESLLLAEKEDAPGQSIAEQIEASLVKAMEEQNYGKCINKLYSVASPLPKKEDMIALLVQFGFKHSTTRGSHFYYVKEKEGKKIFCLIHSHTNELTKAEKKLCLQRILRSLNEIN